uniref:UBC core domain-containing protein n=1 Tax=Cavia porcellus TaxID=10141 RepID=H0VGK8_CAVPO
HLKGISAFPMSEDMMKWKADIEGLQNSIWQGLAFDVEINFTPDYNLVPPAVRFVTIPFHPNVDPDTGEPCIDFLNNSDEWDPTYTLSSILLALQAMLSNPVMENPVNLEAAQMLNEDPYVYQIVLQRLFQRSLPRKKLHCTPPMSAFYLIFRPSKVISFDDYYKTWCRIATSKTMEDHRRPCKVTQPSPVSSRHLWVPSLFSACLISSAHLLCQSGRLLRGHLTIFIPQLLT